MHDPLQKPPRTTAKKIGLLVLLLLVGLTLVLLYPVIQPRFEPKDLSLFLPADTIVYVSFTESNFNPAAQKTAFNFSRVQKSISRWFDITPALATSLWSSVENQAAVAWLPQGDRLLPIILLNNKNPNLLEQLEAENLSVKLVDRHIIALSPEPDALARLVTASEDLSLRSVIPNRYLNPFALIYINTQVALDEPPLESIAFLNYLASLYTINSATFYINHIDNRWEYTAFLDSASLGQDFLSVTPLALFDQLPQNLVVTLNDINLGQMFQTLGRQNPGLAQAYAQIINSWQQAYAFNFTADILPLINQKSDLLITKTNASSTLDFVYQTKLSNRQQQNLDTVIRQVVARRFPEIRTRVLPDNTEVAELFFNPERFSFIPQPLNGVTMFSLPLAETDFSIHYALIGDEAIISNSQAWLEQQIASPKSDKPGCPNEQSSYLVSLPAAKLLGYFGSNTISVYFDQGNFITGCFHNHRL